MTRLAARAGDNASDACGVEGTGAGIDPAQLHLVEDDLSGAAIQELLRQHAAAMEARSPLGTCHYLDLDGLRAPDVTFWSIWSGDDLAGCGALRQLDASHGEVKSMRTADAHQGRGVGTVVLDHLLEVARQRDYRRVSLETGSGEGFAAAHRLYARFGFVECEPFADYAPNGFSRFLTLAL